MSGNSQFDNQQFLSRYDAGTNSIKRHPATAAVRASLETDTQHGAVVPPLHLSSTYTFAGFDQKRPYDYTRSGNPTRDDLANTLAELEGGHSASIVASGMAAITLVCQLLKPDDLLVIPHDCYGGSYRLFTELSNRGAFRLQVIDQNDPAALAAAINQNPTIVWIETPSNPLLRVVDIEAISTAAKSVGALVVADNTFLSPSGQNPIDLGVDIVVHSTTKYLNGHSDVVGGAVIAKAAELGEQLAWWANCLGLTGAPFDAWLTLRGVRTLHARTRLHADNAQELAELLNSHPAVDQVYYPGLINHPQHELAKKQQNHFGGMLSFELAEGYDLATLIENLQHISLAESLGGIESLISHPATMSHASMDADARKVAGISDRLLRLSVGIENSGDLKADFQRAFALAKQHSERAKAA